MIMSRHTLHVKLVSHFVVLSEQRGAGGSGDAATDPLHTHLLFQTLDPARTLHLDVYSFPHHLNKQ